MHWACYYGHAAVVRQVLAADSATALVGDVYGQLPLAVALGNEGLDAVRCLLAEGPPQPAGAQLQQLARYGSKNALPLYAVVAVCQPLTAQEWEQVPAACPGLAAVLPRVLDRSAEESGCLVRRLPQGANQRLRTAALCLARAQRRCRLSLHTPLVWRILALCVDRS